MVIKKVDGAELVLTDGTRIGIPAGIRVELGTWNRFFVYKGESRAVRYVLPAFATAGHVHRVFRQLEVELRGWPGPRAGHSQGVS